MLCALILAGGKGTRFWPLSTEEKPKQFLKLTSEYTMIQITANRVRKIIPDDRIFICTGKRYVSLVKDQIEWIPNRNIIVEPEVHNTAACITLSSLIINRYFKDINIVVMPSDHVIKKENLFVEKILKGDNFLQKNKRAIVTLGVNPTRAEIGYGYIKIENKDSYNLMKVNSFKEKPSKILAKEYVKSGMFLWNTGIFMWNINNILYLTNKYLHKTFNILAPLMSLQKNEVQDFIDKKYMDTENISIDYALLEKYDQIYCIYCDFIWDDVGTWQAIERYRKPDINGNIHVGESITLDGENNMIIAQKDKVLVEGLSNIYVIESNGKILIGRKENLSNIKSYKNII